MGFVLTFPKKNSINHVKQISLGEAHTMVIDLDNTLHAFGWGELGQLGIEIDKKSVFKVYQHKQKFKQVSCGAVFTIAISLDDQLYAWGNGVNGQLGFSIQNLNESGLPI